MPSIDEKFPKTSQNVMSNQLLFGVLLLEKKGEFFMSPSRFLTEIAPYADNISALLYALTSIPRPFLPSPESEFRINKSGVYVNHKTNNESITYERKF